LEKEISISLYLGADYKTAAPLFLKFQPMTADLNYMEGDSLLHLEEAEKAIRYLEAAVRGDPKLLPARGAARDVTEAALVAVEAGQDPLGPTARECCVTLAELGSFAGCGFSHPGT
jgi:hypothetical protein